MDPVEAAPHLPRTRADARLQKAMPHPANDLSVPAQTGEESSSPLHVREVTTLADLVKLERAWEQALAGAESPTPFLTFEWALSWWETFGEGLDLRVFVLEDEAGIAGIAPFVLARRGLGPLSYRCLEILGTSPLPFIGMGLADRTDLLLVRRRPECARALLAHLAASVESFDVVDLRFVPETSTTLAVLRAEAAASGFGVGEWACSESPYLALDGTYKEYLRERGASFRRGLKRKLEKLETHGEALYEMDAGDADPHQTLAAVFATSLASWKARAGSALFQHARVRAFFERLVPRLARTERLYIALLKVDGRVGAYELGYRMHGRLWSYDSAYRHELAAGSPGVLLTAKVIEAAYEEGLREYDFLRGMEDYKLTWRTECRRELQMVLHARRLRARAAYAVAFRAKWALKGNRLIVALQMRLAGLANRARTGRDPAA